jgi:hypothetical protein
VGVGVEAGEGVEHRAAGRGIDAGGVVEEEHGVALRAEGDAIVAAYNARDYHQPRDQLHPDWDFAGTAQEAAAAFITGHDLATCTVWPAWHPTAEFASLRPAR